MKNYLSASEMSRATGHPVSRIIAGIESGLVTPDGRAGSNSNSAFIFDASRVDAIKTALATGTPAPKPAQSRDTSEVLEKAAALTRARQQ